MREMPKRVKRALREAATRAYEEELRRALLPLAAEFDQWRAGHLSSGELTDAIHRFHHGAARELFKRYNYGLADTAVARAIAIGVLDQAELPEELVDHLSGLVALFAEQGDGSQE